MAAASVVALLAAGPAASQFHRVQAGDTLEAVGRRYGVPVAALAAANGIEDPDHIVAGTRIVVPASGTGPSPATRPPETAVAIPTVVAARPAAARPVRIPPDRARLRSYFLQFSRTAGVPPDLAMALAWQESGWQRGIVSSTQAVGVMQLMPDTVEFVSRILFRLSRNLDPGDPAANIRMGTRFLRYLLDRCGGDVDAALASYYQGLRSVRERGPLPETLRFVANVKALRPRF
jgi:LysM repeat protein